jgi:hypothetical protein
MPSPLTVCFSPSAAGSMPGRMEIGQLEQQIDPAATTLRVWRLWTRHYCLWSRISVELLVGPVSVQPVSGLVIFYRSLITSSHGFLFYQTKGLSSMLELLDDCVVGIELVHARIIRWWLSRWDGCITSRQILLHNYHNKKIKYACIEETFYVFAYQFLMLQTKWY